MVNYEIREILYKGKVDDIVFEFEEEYELLSTFLSAEVSNFNKVIIAKIRGVLEGKVEKEKISGNICTAIVERNQTYIYDHLAIDGRGKFCKINTSVLEEIIND